jgi:hypothetical protein
VIENARSAPDRKTPRSGGPGEVVLGLGDRGIRGAAGRASGGCRAEGDVVARGQGTVAPEVFFPSDWMVRGLSPAQVTR